MQGSISNKHESRSNMKQYMKKKKISCLCSALKSNKVILYFIKQGSSDFASKRLKIIAEKEIFTFQILVLKTR